MITNSGFSHIVSHIVRDSQRALQMDFATSLLPRPGPESFAAEYGYNASGSISALTLPGQNI